MIVIVALCLLRMADVMVLAVSGNVLIFQASVSGDRKKVFRLRKCVYGTRPVSAHPSGCDKVSTGSISARTGTQAHLVGTWPTISWNAEKNHYYYGNCSMSMVEMGGVQTHCCWGTLTYRRQEPCV